MQIDAGIDLTIRAAYGDLRNSEKRVADYILENLSSIRTMTLEQLAKESGVSQPTVVRMLKAVGYDSFKALKYAIVEEMAKDEGKTQGEVFCGYPVAESDEVREIPLKIASAACSEIQKILKSISLQDYENIVEKLREARTIDVYGIENSSSACMDLSTKLLYLGYNVRYVSDPYLQQISAATLTSKDVAVGISYSGASKDTVDAIGTARKKGAVTIVLTNFQDAPISKYADYILCSAQEQLFYGNAIFSRMPQILMIDMIYMGLIASDFKRSTETLKHYSRLIENKAYDDNENV